MERTILQVEGMSCSHCSSAVKNAVSALPGVTSVSVDLSKKTVTVDYDSVKCGLDNIKHAIEDEGYTVNMS